MHKLDRIIELKEMYDKGLIPTLEVHEVHPSLEKTSRENYLYFTLPPCINFQRSSPAMWRSALDTWNDKTTNYVFFPEKLMKIKYEKFKQDMAKYNLALLRNKHCEIWWNISETIFKHYESNPENILKEGDFDVIKITELIQKSKRHLFPHLRGAKLSNYWLMIIHKFTGAKLKNLNKINIIPDTHIIKSTIKLGFVKESEASPEKVIQIWDELLENSGILPLEMHSVLWNWDRANL